MFGLGSDTVLYYIAICLIAAGTPGPGTLAVLNSALLFGVRRTLPVMFGILFGMGVVSVATVTGLSALILHSELAFMVIKYIGGLYIGYLGVRILWPLFNSKQEAMKSQKSERKMTFVTGVILSIFNPKTLMFFTALLPAFIHQHSSLVSQTFTLTLILLLCTFAVHLAYSKLCTYVSDFFVRHMRWVDAITGLMFVCFSIVVLWLS
ncbi:LysE family translocator [Marinomonas rhizomae]|uniref:LysE family translocator n=1 Tax=Marinomonas rhizomae TaxID=491948 RepID=UPI00210540D0|nr:LysE family translocator [Marinomonas rhizomae]UTV97747.1 LysE family translocator [Marinomonas rhizomae]